MDIKYTIRLLRKNQTKAETILWNKLRNRQFLGLKFVRQYPIIFDYENKKHFYIADFYCHSLKLVLEIDGKIHNIQKDRDNFRDYVINLLGFVVIRCTNEKAFSDIDSILKEISSVL